MKLANRKKSIAAVVVALGLLVVLIAVISGGSIVAADSESAPEGNSVSPSGEPPLYIGEPGAASSRFSILTAATPSTVEALPSSAVSLLANSQAFVTSSPTLNALGTVDVGQESEITVAEAGLELCMVVNNPDLEGAAAGACSPLGEAEEGGNYVTLPDLVPGSVRLIGLAPDGITDIGIDANADGTPDRTIPVSSNVYQVDLDPVTTTISGLSGDGGVAYEVELPLSVHAQPKAE